MRFLKSIFVKLLALGMVSVSPVSANAEYTLERPDIETASSRYKKRFNGATGEWFLKNQTSHLLDSLAPWRGATVLDIGGGHGQYTEALIQHGYTVTVMGSTPEADEQVRPLLASGRCHYAVGDLHKLPFADQSFDVVISFRLMAHLKGWKDLVNETARVARRAVIIDYPVLHSFNALYPFLFWLKRATEGDTRTYEVFDEHDVIDEFQKTGFNSTARHPQYFFPMAAHRALHAPSLSAGLERLCEKVGLTDRFGSPVILRVEPSRAQQAVRFHLERTPTATAAPKKAQIETRTA